MNNLNYREFFDPNRVYHCKVVFNKGTTCQIVAEEVPVQLLGLPSNFEFPRRPVLAYIVGMTGTCKVIVNPKNENGLMAVNINLGISPICEDVMTYQTNQFTNI